MGKTRQQKRIIGFVLAVFLAGGFLLLPLQAANANAITDIAAKVFISPIGWVANLLSWIISGTLLPIAAWLVSLVFGAGDFIRNPLVTAGWEITRDLANMFFILILLVIGLATILRMETYGIKRLLPRLILMALLINFSLVIAGVFIDIGNDLGLFFTSGGDPTVKVGDNITAALKLSQTFEPPANPDSGSDEISILIRRIMSLAFIAVATFLLFAMALIMIFRIVYLWILLILAPLAWVANILPDTKQYWKKWWNEFLKWAFFPAVFGFFIYLALLTGLSFNNKIFAISSDTPAALNEKGLVPFHNMAFFLQYLAVLFILFYGVISAVSWTGSFANTGLKWAGKARDWSLGKAKGGVKFGFKAATQAVPEPARRWTREKLEKAPLGIGRLVGGPGARYAAQQKTFKDQRAKLKNLRPQDLEAIADQVVATPGGQARRAAAVAELAKKRRLTDKQKKYFRDFLNAGGDAKEVLSSRPDWALDENIQGLLAANPATAEDWKSIAAMASGSVTRQLEAEKVIRGKVMPTVASDFAKIQKEALTDDILYLIATELGEGGRLYVAHLNALGSKNPATYETLKSYLKRDDVIENLSESVQKHLKAGLLAAVMEEEKEEAPAPAAPTPRTAKT